MFPPRISRPSCGSAWLAASQTVHALPGHEAYHVVIDVEDPVAQSSADAAVIGAVDAFLHAYTKRQFLVRTVANTIFPQATFENHGSPDFYGVYIDKVFPRLKQSPRDWGRYQRQNPPLLLNPRPPPTPLRRRQNFNPPKRHVTIPMDRLSVLWTKVIRKAV